MSCGISASITHYVARGLPNPAVTGAPPLMCHYGCLANLTSCRQCGAVDDGSGDDSAPDADGLSIWRYLACKYRGITNAEGDDLAHSYVFGSGQYFGIGSDMGTTDCMALKMAG